MRLTFLYPIFNKTRKGQLDWLFEQAKKWFALKFFRKIYPNKIRVGPTMAVLTMTYRCNSNCLMCDLKKRASGRKEYSFNEWKNIINQLAEIKTAGIGFTGGEPLLVLRIAELIDYANQKRMSTTLNTNGLLFTPGMIKVILKAQPDNINISLDSPDPETFDRLRGTRHGLNRLKKIIKELIKERDLGRSLTKVTIVSCVSHHNLEELEKIAKLAADLKVDKLGFIPMHSFSKKKAGAISTQDPFPRIGQRFEEAVSKIKASKIIPLDNSSYYTSSFPLAFEGKKFPLPCLAGKTSINIDCYGQVFTCLPFLELNKPSFKLSPPKKLKDFWLGKEFEKIDKAASSCRDCFWNCHAELSIFYR